MQYAKVLYSNYTQWAEENFWDWDSVLIELEPDFIPPIHDDMGIAAMRDKMKRAHKKVWRKKTFLTHIAQSREAPLQVEVPLLWQPHTTRRPEQQSWFVGGIGSWRSSLVPFPFLWTKWKIPESDLIKHKGTTQNRRSLKIFPFVYLIQVLTCMLQSSSWGKPENWRATNLERTFDISPPFALPSRIEWWNGNYPSIVILMMFQQLTWMQADPPTKPRDLLVQDCSPAILL